MLNGCSKVLCIFFVFGFGSFVHGFIQSIPLPEKFSECVQKRTRGLKPSDFPGHSISSHCIRSFKIRQMDVNKLTLDIPAETLSWVNSLLRQLQIRRHKRTPFPRRIRKEIRRLTEHERYDFLKAVMDLKADTSVFPNRYDAIARIHSGNFTIESAHESSNFLGWHRIYLLVMEQALREKNPKVTIPYWDSSVDFDMDDPTHSVIWTSAFMGNGDGVVNSGPFANWITGDNVHLIRNTGSTGSLISKAAVANVLSRTYHVEINEGTTEPRFSLEGHHGGVHRWVDGQMSGLHTSAQDPIFFLHHSFVDYLWHLFRNKQKQNGINPATDYPPTNHTLHEPFRPMAGFAPLKNIDGFSNYWDSVVDYEDSPSSCAMSNDCGSIFLQCIQGQCVSKDLTFIETPTSSHNLHSKHKLSKQMAEALGPLPIGRRFGYYFLDQRTRNDPMPIRHRSRVNNYNGLPIPFGKVLHKELHDWRFPSTGNGSVQRPNAPGNNNVTTSIAELWNSRNAGWVAGANWKSGNTGGDVEAHWNRGITGGSVESHNNMQGNSMNKMSSFQNTFQMNGKADINKWVFFPVCILYRKPRISLRDGFGKRKVPIGYQHCKMAKSGKQKIVVHSDGIDYTGTYTDFAEVKNRNDRKRMCSAVAHTAVKNPSNGVSKAIISAYDSCGRMCKPTCLDYSSSTPRYTPCSGTVKLTGNVPKLFEAPKFSKETSFQVEYEIPIFMKNKIFMTFRCFYENSWPWDNCNI